jgi:hypothetical protein
MRVPDRMRAAIRPRHCPNGLKLFPIGLNCNEAASVLRSGQLGCARWGSKRMPRPGRWSRLRGASSKRKPRKTKPCSLTRFQEGQRLETNVHQNTSVRQELVVRIRQAIRSGEYDTPAKLEAALERLLTQLVED